LHGVSQVSVGKTVTTRRCGLSLGRKRAGRKALSAFTSLMVLFALVVPFVGSAGAQQQNQITGLTLTPETDSAPTGTCNAFTVTLTEATTQQDPNPGAEGETVDVRVVDADQAQAPGNNQNQSNVQFCQPALSTTPNTGGNSGPNPQSPSEVVNQGNNPTQRNAEFTPTDANGQITFGILSTDTGTFSVTAYFDADNDDQVDANEFQDTSTKTFTAGGAQAARTVSCVPDNDSNPEGTTHTFLCTVSGEGGAALANVGLSFDVTQGPNNEEIGPTPCQGGTFGTAPNQTVTGGTTNQQGQIVCSYTDTGNNTANSLPGTDTIVAFVNQQSTTGGATGPGLDPGEPSDQITKTWFGPANNIQCVPDQTGQGAGQTTQPGGVTTVTCTVTDASNTGTGTGTTTGNPVPGITISFTETGPGVFRNPNQPQTCTTGANGSCSVEIQTAANEEGTTTVTGTIVGVNNTPNTPNQAQPGTQSNCTNGTPTAGTNARCSDTATIVFAQQQPQEFECSNNEDDDNDGDTDFPNDEGCFGAEDDSEDTDGEGPGDPEEVRHERNVQITRDDHVRIPGKGKGLLIRGVVTSTDFESCAQAVPVKVQILVGGEWITRKSDTTNDNGVFKVLIRHVHAKYRAVATRYQIEDTDNNRIDICERASDEERHRRREG